MTVWFNPFICMWVIHNPRTGKTRFVKTESEARSLANRRQ